MNLYLRSVIANKFTLAGYIMVCTTAISFPWAYQKGLMENDAGFLLYLYGGGMGFILLAITTFGLQTQGACLRTLRMLGKNQKKSSAFEKYYRSDYCTRVGERLAHKIYEESSEKKPAA